MPLLMVRGNSMKPGFPPGTLVVVQDVRCTDILAGNVIVFRGEHGLPVMHRVLSVRGGIVTRGDNATVTDGIVAPERILGRVVGRCGARRSHTVSRSEELLWLVACGALALGRRTLATWRRGKPDRATPDVVGLPGR
jgi:hypothetical protein